MMLEEVTVVQRQITLSDDANEFIQQQLATGQFASPDEVVSKTLEDARIAAAKKKLAELIREGLESKGEDIEFTEEWFDRRMDEAKAEVERRRSA
jgi:Arc/MetJ-type ribon-helix-helix transcriptional regulator